MRKALLGLLDFLLILWQPCFSGHQHLIHHLDDFVGGADSARERIHQGRLAEKGDVARNGGFHCQLLYPDALGANSGAA